LDNTNLEFSYIEGSKLTEAYEVMKELRAHLTLNEFHAIYDRAHTQDKYQIMAAKEGDKIVALMGLRTLCDYVHGEHLYIDDLVVTHSHRGRGIGALLLRKAEELATQKRVKGLRLCTGKDMDDAKRFYEREGWSFGAVAYKKKL